MNRAINSIISLIPWLLLLGKTEKTDGFFDPTERSVAKRYRGFFAFVVLLHHMAQRVEDGGLLYMYFDAGYLAVAVFFFYSGYGLMKKGIAQKRGFFKKRLPKVLFPYVATMAIYWVIYAINGDEKGIGALMSEHYHSDRGISFLWFVFVYLAWTLFFGLSLRVIKQDKMILAVSRLFAEGFAMLCLLTIPYFFWVYDTILLIPIGCAWQYYEKTIIGWIQKHYYPFLGVCIIGFVGSCLAKTHPVLLIPAYMCSAILFVVLLNVMTMKQRPQGKALAFLGDVSYEIYVLHGIPITFLKGIVPYESAWTLAVLLVTVIGAFVMHGIGNRTWNRMAQDQRVLLKERRQEGN